MIHRIPKGVTLLECMLLVVILAIVFLGFGIAMQSTARVPVDAEQRLAIHTLLVDKMEDIASLDFATIAANAGLSDTVSFNGQSLPRTVTVKPIDADGLNGVDNDFLEVKVAIADQYLKTRVTQP
jgi:Tfp pilus assembly protein PilV